MLTKRGAQHVGQNRPDALPVVANGRSIDVLRGITGGASKVSTAPPHLTALVFYTYLMIKQIQRAVSLCRRDRPVLHFLAQGFFDCIGNLRTSWADFAGKIGDYLAVAIDQKFVKIPLWRGASQFCQ